MVESKEQAFASTSESVELPETHGSLIIIGGAEDKDGDCKILREFVRRAGGLQARVAIMTAATGSPREVGDRYTDVFSRLGVEDIRVVDTSSREDSEAREILEKVEDATGIFFTGGDQARILDIMKDTKLDELLHQRLAEGAVVAGTSAGAAMMPDKMIVVGESETHARPDTVEIDRGMGFLPNVVIDQHFAQRGRLNRLLTALALEPATIGFGIDENTAIIVNGHIVEIVGEGSVTIVDEEEVTHNNIQGLLKDEALALCGIKLHILPAGYRFDLRSRSCLC